MGYTYGTVTHCKVANGTTRNEYECRLGYQVNSQSIPNNTSNVTLRLQVRSTSSSYCTKGTGQTTKIDGTTVASNKAMDMTSTNTWQTFGERTITISHNNDGTCSVSKSGSFTCTAGSSNYSLRSGSASVTVHPNNIARASEPSLAVNNITLGGDAVLSTYVYTNRASNNFTHTIKAKIGNFNQTIGTNVGTSVSYTPSWDMIHQVPNATSGTAEISCETYNGSSYIGTKSTNLYFTVDSSVKPYLNGVSFSEADQTMISKNLGVYVKGKSKIKMDINASMAFSSPIKFNISNLNGSNYTNKTDTSYTTGYLNTSGSNTVSVTVNDNRGRSTSGTYSYNVVDYSRPIITERNCR